MLRLSPQINNDASSMKQSRLWFDKARECIEHQTIDAMPDLMFKDLNDLFKHLKQIRVRGRTVSKLTGRLNQRKDHKGKDPTWKVFVRNSVKIGEFQGAVARRKRHGLKRSDKQSTWLEPHSLKSSWGFDTHKLGNRSRITEVNFAKVLLDCYKAHSIGSELVDSGEVPLHILKGSLSLVQLCKLDIEIQHRAKHDFTNLQLYLKASAQVSQSMFCSRIFVFRCLPLVSNVVMCLG